MIKKGLKIALEYIKRLDKVLILLCVSASVFGIVLLYSMYVNGFASVNAAYYKTQITALCLGVAAMLVVAALAKDRQLYDTAVGAA